MAVTVLAFVYVPLNLATSIFGMNLQELNQNGQQLWVFMTTAVTVLIITTGSWFFLEQVNNYKIWRRGAREKPSRHRRGTKWALAKRVAMLVWLLENGHRSWMQTSGAWWRILVNDETAVSDWSTLSSYSPDGHTEVSRMTAGDYVTKFSATQIPGFNPFDPKHFPKDEIDFRVIGPHYAISRLFIRFFPIRSLRNAWRRRRE